ncbi:hypothetical protein H0H81_011989 [Sphagnurus paluster]|uniref:Homeobox domain-containing protein n=1 Tax=Sphagnurus paluster TaxID=117069 RepID=A0A9P7GI91_9AGAR|nr:hypothetical protein H0H81_011989 [Sphagnurus paluster]
MNPSDNSDSLRKLLSKISPHMSPICPPGPENSSDTASGVLLLLSQLAQQTSCSSLRQTGLSPTATRKLSEACIRAAKHLRDVSATDVSIPSDAAHAINKDWKAAHAQQTRQWAEDALSYVNHAIAKANSPDSGKPLKDKRQSFNHEFTPLLEKYFEYNAYPSAADRAVLARKSMMTPRQIEVWFQNHRNRARKEGKPLRKLTEDPLPLEISLKSLERKMPFFTIPEQERKSVKEPVIEKEDNSDEEDIVSISSPPYDAATTDVLSQAGPSHAFPTAYPPRCDYEPFPTKTGQQKFPAPTWYRKPAAPRRPSKTPINMDEFITDFQAKLHLRAPLLKKRSKTGPSWCATRATIPPPAPHPALVRRPLSPTPTPSSRLLTVPASPSRLHAFQSPSPCSQPVTLIPTEHVGDAPTRRKVARLPKRTPKNTSIAHRRGSPAVSEGSPPPSRMSSFGSRSWSFGSESTSNRRPSSSSSSSSSPSSALTTPVLATSELPEDVRSPVSISGVDFDENADNLYGSRHTMSSVEDMPFHFSMSAQTKFHHVPSAVHMGSRYPHVPSP